MPDYKFGAFPPSVDGIPMVGGFPTGLTNVFFVDFTTGNDGVNTKANSLSRPFKTIDKALDVVTTNKNEGIALIGNATHTLTEMLSVSKNRTHMFGYDPGGRTWGQNAKVSLGVTTAATDIGTIQNTGIRNSFSNMKVLNSNTVAEGLFSFVEAGEFTVLQGCEIFKETDLDVAGAAELVMNGDTAMVRSCTIGSDANVVTANGARPNVLLTREIVTGKVSRDSVFVDCIFPHNGTDTDNRMVHATGATDVERLLLFKDCLFFNNVLSSGAPAQAISSDAALTQGRIVVMGGGETGCTALSTTTGVFSMAPTYAAGGGSGIQAT